jgi:hypothetical protein
MKKIRGLSKSTISHGFKDFQRYSATLPAGRQHERRMTANSRRQAQIQGLFNNFSPLFDVLMLIRAFH